MMKKSMFLLGILFLIGIQGVSAQSGTNDTEEANITVTISAVTMIDVVPTDFTYTADPGESCGRDLGEGLCNETSDNYFAIQVENIGSWNITQVWFNVSQPTQTPFATGSTDYVDPGNFIAMTTSENSSDFYFVDRKEYPAIKTLVYLRDIDGNMPANLSKYAYGRLHNGSMEYFWMLDSGNTSNCNGSASYIRIGTSPHTQTSTGSTDFETDSGEYVQMNLTVHSADTSYAITNVTGGPLEGYAIGVDSDCSVRFSKWNKDIPFDETENANYSYNGILTPGDSVAKRIGIMVPYGIYAGAKTGQLTALAVGGT